MLALLGIAFLAGLVTALSPCVLPVLPLLLAGSAASESRWRPYVILAGLVVSFTIFTLRGAAFLSALGLPQDLLRTIAIVMLLVLAATLVSPRFARLVERPFLYLTRRPIVRESGGFVLGTARAGLVMVPCAGLVSVRSTDESSAITCDPSVHLRSFSSALLLRFPERPLFEWTRSPVRFDLDLNRNLTSGEAVPWEQWLCRPC